MKIKPEHYTQLENAINRVRNELPHSKLEEYLEAGNTAKRYRWDLLWYASRAGFIRIVGRAMGGVDCPIYEYANDDHIDTALRKITGTK